MGSRLGTAVDRTLSSVALLLVLVLFGAACADSTEGDETNAAAEAVAAARAEERTGGDAPATEDRSAASEAVEPAPANDAAAAVAAGGRIVVSSTDGRIYVVAPDGSGVVDLVGENAGTAIHPAWSPDGARVAWARVDDDGFWIDTTNADGSEARSTAAPFGGYLTSWSSSSDRVGMLGTVGSGTGLVIDDLSGTPIDEPLQADSFYFFSWSPDGTRWVAHSGGSLRILDTAGNETTIGIPGGVYRAPVWTPEGTIIVAVRLEEGNMLVEIDPDTADVTELVLVGDATNFVLDRSGRYLAIESLVAAVAAEPSLQNPVDDSPIAEAAVLVLDRTTGDVQIAFDGLTAGFWWSPDGDHLAVMVPVESTGDVRWLLWNRDESFVSDPFTPTPLFARSYAPFFDQFHQAVTPWSPDGSWLVYTGFDDTGEPAAFVLEAAVGAEPQRIASDAAVAFWSPR